MAGLPRGGRNRRVDLPVSLSVPLASLTARYRETSALVASVRDIIDERASPDDAPRWCVQRGWAPALFALSDDHVLLAERDGFSALAQATEALPSDLRELARDVAHAVSLPRAEVSASSAVDPRRANLRKREQVSAFAHLVAPLAEQAARIVDVGSGHGHLTRHLARAFDVPTEGWERDQDRTAVAASLTRESGPRFVTIEASRALFELGPTDLIVGLHACGALGDSAIEAAAETGAGIALVSCCLQKRDGDRVPLGSLEGAAPASLTLGRAILGLSNAREGNDGIEADLPTRTASRTARIALRNLLTERGIETLPGEEMRGVNRRRATGELRELVRHVFELRGLVAPSENDIARAHRHALEASSRSRRWELPRTMMARLIEVWVALDRASHLEGRGRACTLVEAFSARESPRNLLLMASA